MSFKLKVLSAPIKSSLIMMSLALPIAAQAKDISVKITNLTNGFYFTPIVVAAHSSDVNFYDLGEPASEALQAMAEGGNISGLVSQAEAENADVATNPANGLLAPGQSATAVLTDLNRYNKYLSVAAMLLPTNDGFFGADSIKIPKRAGTYSYYLNAYDAGTEANDEIINGGGAPNTPGIPAAPGGVGGYGVTSEEANKTVHVHRGTLGDDIAEGGASDLNRSIHTWLNPVVKMEIIVSCDKRDYYAKGCR